MEITAYPGERYTIDAALRSELNRREPLASYRKSRAEMWRSARRKNPKLARLLWRAMRQTRRELADRVFFRHNSADATLLDVTDGLHR